MIAFGTPGRHGDIHLCLPAVSGLCKKHSCNADLYIRGQFQKIRPFLMMQPCINDVLVVKGFENRIDTGFPYEEFFKGIPHGKYDKVYQLRVIGGSDTFLPDMFCDQCGIDRQPLRLTYENQQPSGRYLSIDGKAVTKYPRLMDKVFRMLGVTGDSIRDVGSVGVPFDKKPGIIEGSFGFIGVNSCPLVVASFIPGIRRVALIDAGIRKYCIKHSDDDLVVEMRGDKDDQLSELIYNHINRHAEISECELPVE